MEQIFHGQFSLYDAACFGCKYTPFIFYLQTFPPKSANLPQKYHLKWLYFRIKVVLLQYLFGSKVIITT